MALSRTTSRLFSKAPAYTRPSQSGQNKGITSPPLSRRVRASDGTMWRVGPGLGLDEDSGAGQFPQYQKLPGVSPQAPLQPGGQFPQYQKLPGVSPRAPLQPGGQFPQYQKLPGVSPQNPMSPQLLGGTPHTSSTDSLVYTRRQGLLNPQPTETPQSIHQDYLLSPSLMQGPYAPITVNGMYADSAATRRADIMREMNAAYALQDAAINPSQQNPMQSGTGLFSVPPESIQRGIGGTGISSPFVGPQQQTNRFVGPQNPMQPPVNMSGFQGAPTAQGMGIAGMIPGFGGMAAQGYMAALGKGYQAAMSGTGMQAPQQGPQNLIPSPQNSLQAGMNAMGNPMNATTASQSNGYYSPPSSVNQGREYGLTLPMDLAGQQNRIANQNPMYAGMQSRFGAGSVMGQQAAMIAQNEGAGNIRIPGSYGEMPTYVQKGESPEVRYRSNKNGDQVSFNSNNDPVLRRQQAALRNFTPNAERGANRKAAREATKARLADSRFKMQVSKGLNPNSAKAKAMFPEQVAKMQGMSPNNPMAQAGPPGSIESQMQGAGKVAEDLASNPHLVAIGATPDSSLQDVNAGMTAHLESGGTFTDESLKAFQQHAVARGKTKTKDNDPFSFTPSFGETQSAVAEGPLWQQLAEMPDTPEARAQWFQMYKDLKEQTKKRAADSLYRNPPRAGA